MSLIPFILDLADELHELNRCFAAGVDGDDFGFGIYPYELQQLRDPQPLAGPQQQHPLQQQQQHHHHHHQQQQLRRPRAMSQMYWLPTKRHHPYNRSVLGCRNACCGKASGSGDEAAAAAAAAAATAAVAGEKDLSPSLSASPLSSTAVPSASSAPGKAAAYSVVNKNGFQVSMNVKQFAPNELTVKTIDNCIVVEGRHDDKEDGHGVISRHFVRKYMLPKGYDPNDVLSTLSSDGILTVRAPPPAAKADARLERIVDIQQSAGCHAPLAAKECSREPPKKTTATSAVAPLQSQLLPETQQKEQHDDRQEGFVAEAAAVSAEARESASAANTAATADAAKAAEKPLTSSCAVKLAANDTTTMADGDKGCSVLALSKAKENADAAAATADINVTINSIALSPVSTSNDNGFSGTFPVADVDVDMEPVAALSPPGATAVGGAGGCSLKTAASLDGAACVDAAAAVAATGVEAMDSVVIGETAAAENAAAAADAAVLLAKAQVENGNKEAPTEAGELAN